MSKFAANRFPHLALFLATLSFQTAFAQGELEIDRALLMESSLPSYVAGFRAAYILSIYPDFQFPRASYWSNVASVMTQKFSSAAPAAIWVVSLYLNEGMTQLGFPSSGRNHPYLAFAPWDYSEPYLRHFDSTGVKIWLEVEPGAANVDTLIHLTLRRYGHHPCVVGLGVDVEWYHAQAHTHGREVTDEEAQRWERLVQSYNPAYTLFLKHYSPAWMPPSYRGDLLFIDDSQKFFSAAEMIDEFKRWGEKFFPNRVGFQLGYPADERWWGKLNDPPVELGDALFSSIPNTYGVFWVDFTITQIFPIIASAVKSSLRYPVNSFQ